MSADTGLATIGQAASEAAALVAGLLPLDAEPGPGFDLWAEEAKAGDLLSKRARAWSAPLLGPRGHCGEIALVLPAGAKAPAETQVSSALQGAVGALTGACGADRLGEISVTTPDELSRAKPGHRARAVPLLSDGERTGMLVVVTPASQAPADLPSLDLSAGVAGAPRSINTLADVEMTVSVELGRTKLPIRDLLAIHNGAVVQLDRSVNHPVDIFVHGTLIARGEVVVVDECFAVRVTELLTGD